MRLSSLTTMHAHAILTLMLATLCLAAKGREPKAPGLDFLYTVNITGGPTTVIGPGPRGLRLVVPIAGGSFSGPKLKGILLNPSLHSPKSIPDLPLLPLPTRPWHQLTRSTS
jgi:hypothetical protein